jgi:hypothetical protein
MTTSSHREPDMTKLLLQTLFILAAMLAATTGFAQTDLAIGRPPPLLIVRGADQPVRLTDFRAEAVVLGPFVRTTIELTFRNPNARILEGELQFPLLEGQQIAGFALDFDGHWRPAVPVDKARGRQVFEDVTRTRIDPALLEKTVGNNFKLRLYPLPPQGDRRVQITIEERLAGTGSGGEYRLALPGVDRIERFDFRLLDRSRKASELKPGRTLAGLLVRDAAGGATIAFSAGDYRPEGLLSVTLAGGDGPVQTTGKFDGRQYFYAELMPDVPAAGPRPRPRRLALVWDASGSGLNRDHGRELALLDAYFADVAQLDVDLVVLRDRLAPPQHFAVKAGDWSALRKELEGIAYDGATALAALPRFERADAVLLVSDGLGNYGKPAAVVPSAPVFAINAAPVADVARLRHLAEQSGGAFVDLTRTPTATAVKLLRTGAAHLVSLQSFAATELTASSRLADGGRLAVAGILSEADADISLTWQLPDGQRRVQHLRVAPGAGSEPFAAREWARLRLAELDAERDIHRAEIRRLGKAFGLVSSDTSLIVLDRIEDYVRHEIVPPPELQVAYEQALARRQLVAAQDCSARLEQVVRRFEARQSWWQKDFPKGERPQDKARRELTAPGSPAPAPAVAGAVMAERAAPADMAMPRMAAPAPQLAAAKSADASSGNASQAVIRLQPWRPDSAYADRLRQADAGQRYRIYLDERAGNLQSTAFYLDAADIFFELGDKMLGLRALSNLAEMDLENRAILRILGYRLLQAGEPGLAVPVFERVLDLAPDEPQSWRDLGLAEAEAGEMQKAIDHLYQVVIRPWDSRFPDIDMTALAEMNALIATAKVPLRTEGMDRRLLRNLPLDLRAVLTWDSDNTDIDLWVTDPNGEKTFYGSPLSYQGGRMSSDFTGGYGPEEFALRTAKPGRYLVQAQFYGHRQQTVSSSTTLQLKLSTGFGTAAQKDQRVTLRLKSTGALITVGEFVVGGR